MSVSKKRKAASVYLEECSTEVLDFSRVKDNHSIGHIPFSIGHIPHSIGIHTAEKSKIILNFSPTCITLSVNGNPAADLTTGLASWQIVELINELKHKSLNCFYHTSSSDSIAVLLSLAPSTSDNKRLYPVWMIRWCLGSNPPPLWMDVYFPALPSNQKASNSSSTLEGKSLCDKILNDISASNIKKMIELPLYSAREISELEIRLSELGLATKLRDYQLKGILWLQNHMRHIIDVKSSNIDSYGTLDGWMPLSLVSPTIPSTDNKLYYSIVTGELSTTIPSSLCVYGGVLADFMGLGKSIQIICLLLLNKPSNSAQSIDLSLQRRTSASSSSSSSYSSSALLTGKHGALARPCTCGYRSLPYPTDIVTCVRCLELRHACCIDDRASEKVCLQCVCTTLQQSPQTSSAALLILPRGLISQWLSELRKHVPLPLDSLSALKVHVYEGVSKTLKSMPQDSSSALSVNPRHLSSHDIVIAALDTLKEEVHLLAQSNSSSQAPSIRSRRNPNRVYMRPISPLMCLEWNIVVVDETQKIEGESNASKMAMNIPARHRFMVSGTPMAHYHLDDLHYLLKFLRVAPFDTMHHWQGLITSPMQMNFDIIYKKLLELMSSIVLRRRKEDVEMELQSTSQQTQLQFLQFSSFEKLEYEAYEKSVCFSLKAAEQKSVLGKVQQGNLMHLVENLRKGCCHPQAFSKNLRHNPLSFDDIIITRAEKLALELEDEQRKLVFTLTGLAGCCLLLEDESFGSLRRLETATANIYFHALDLFEKNREVCDLLAIGLLSEEHNLLQITTKSVRADNLDLQWKIHPLPFLSAIFAPPSIYTPDSQAIIPKELPSSVLFKGTVGLSAKVDFGHSKRVYEVIGSPSQQSWRKLVSSLASSEGVVLLLFPSHIRVQGGLLNKSIDIHLPLPSLVNEASVDGSNGKNWRPLNEMGEKDQSFFIGRCLEGIRSKSFTIRVESFHNTGLLLRPNESCSETKEDNKTSSQIHWIVTDIASASAVAAECCLPLLPHCSLHLIFRGALFDIDVFQELHLRENLRRTLDALIEEGTESLALDGRMVDFPHLFSARVISELIDDPPLNNCGTTPTKSPLKSTGSSSLLLKQLVKEQDLVTSRLRTEYVQRALNRRLVSEQELQRVVHKVLEKEIELKGLQRGNTPWWEDVLKFAIQSNDSSSHLGSALIGDIRSAVQAGQLAYTSLAGLHTCAALKKAISEGLFTLERARHDILSAFTALETSPSEAAIAETSDCKVCCASHQKTGPICGHCKLATRLREYSALLFSFRRRFQQLKMQGSYSRRKGEEEGNEDEFIMHERQEAEVDGATVMLLREMRRFLTASVNLPILTCFSTSQLITVRQAAKVQEEILSLLQQEVRLLNSLWINHQMLLFAYDDLQQAVTTLELDDGRGSSRNGCISRFEIPERYSTDYLLAQQGLHELAIMSSKMRFIRYEEMERRSAHAERDCVICQCSLESEVRMLPCLHAFHEDCIMRWLVSPAGRRCPLCQSRTTVKDLTPVENSVIRRGTQPAIKVHGDFGTKINFLLGDLLLLTRNTTEKAIVFSQWSEMLQIISTALHANQIRHTCCYNAQDLSSLKGRKGRSIMASSPLDQFKNDIDIRVLLIPLALGSDGLSIIEASHVFLLEPLINQVSESQAVARIARIGQTLPTVVHKYILKDTIEEKIFISQKNITADISNGSERSPQSKKARANYGGIIRKERLANLLTNLKSLLF